MKAFLCVAVSLVPALAFAGPKPLPGDQHEPKLVVDPGAAWVDIVSKDKTYGVQATIRVVGATSNKDRIRFDWRAHGKVTPGKCESRVSGKSIWGHCETSEDLKDVGPVDLDIIYSDDQTDKDYVVATYHLTIKQWKGIGKSMNWGFTPDDLLAVAYVRTMAFDTGVVTPYFEYWTASQRAGGDMSLRCTVDGKKLPDIDGSIDHPDVGGQETIDNDIVTPSWQRHYAYHHVSLQPNYLRAGVKPAADKVEANATYLIDHPGKWECNARSDGKVFRQLMFTVDDKGTIQSGTLQDGQHPLALPENVVMIDMRIPKDNGFDDRIRADALKKTIGFGQAWPDGSGVKATKAAFPPSSGTPD